MNDAQKAASNWDVAPLSEVATTQLGKTINPREKNGPRQRPYLRNANVQWNSFRLDDVASMHFSESESEQYRLARGDLLVCEGGEVGRAAIWHGEIEDCHFQNALHRIRPRDNRVTAEWLLQNLRKLVATGEIAQRAKGNTILHLSQSELRALPITIPPREQQDAILSTITLSDLKRESAMRHLSTARQAIEYLRQAILAAACSGRLTADWREDHPGVPPHLAPGEARRPKQLRDLESYDLDEIPEAWTWAQVEDLLPPGGIFDGPFGSNLKSSDYTDSGARVVRLENIGHLKFIEDKQTYVSPAKFQALLKHAVHPGDIVFSSFVEEKVRVCVLPDTLDRETVAKADCFTLRPLPVVDRHYLALQLASPSSYRNLAGDIHGATRPRVNTTQVRSLPIPLCSLDEQREIVQRYFSLMTAADSLQGRIEIAMRRIDLNSQAILTKAFRGELVRITT